MTVKFAPSGFFVLRTPLLPVNVYEHWTTFADDTAARLDKGDSFEVLHEFITHASASQRTTIAAMLGLPGVREAIYVASPVMANAIPAWERDPFSEKGRRAESSLVRYMARMARRPTPFGLFAGCSVGSVGSSTALNLDAAERNRRVSRLDMDYLTALTDVLSTHRTLWPFLTFRPNTSFFAAADRFHYVETRVNRHLRTYELVAVDRSVELERLLTRSTDGCTYEELVTCLVDDEISREDAELFVIDVIESQVVVPDLLPTLSGPEPLHELIETLSRASGYVDMTETLRSLRLQLDTIDTAAFGSIQTNAYEQVGRIASTLPITVDPARLLQVDLFKPLPGGAIGPKVTEEIERSLDALIRMQIPVDQLKEFRTQFVERYERELVPLAQVLDAELGIGLPMSDTSSSDPKAWQRRSMKMAGLALDAIARGSNEIVLDDVIIGELGNYGGSVQPPDALSVNVSLLAESAEAVDRGEFQLLWNGATGPSGAILLARFAHLDDTLRSRLLAHVEAEEAMADAIFAEVVHLPQGRIGNIASRPKLRAFEIPFLGRSTLPLAQQIDINDLLVTVANDRILLYSQRYGREVRPRLSSAHNFAHPGGLAVYRFLAYLQDRQMYFWDWAQAGALPFHPRVRYGRTIFWPASWTVPHADVNRLRAAKDAERLSAVHLLRQRLRMPRHVQLQEEDNLLPIDLASALSVDALFDRVKPGSSLQFVEALGSRGMFPVSGPGGRYVNELVVPFVREAPKFTRTQPLRHPAVNRQLRRHAPGGEWHYTKFYTGATTCDRILRDAVAPLVETLDSAGAIDRWFFVRYPDPSFHIRLRIRSVDEARDAVRAATQGLTQQLVARGLVWKVQDDTYQPEIERYGGANAVVLAERIFQEDSRAVLALLGAYSGKANATIRQLFALGMLDAIFTGFRRTEDESVELLVAAERALPPGVVKSLGQKYRGMREQAEALFAAIDRQHAHGSSNGELEPAAGIVARFAERIAEHAGALRILADSDELAVPLPELLMTFTHMHVNRLLIDYTREEEMSCYNYLRRYYQSRRARRSQHATSPLAAGRVD